MAAAAITQSLQVLGKYRIQQMLAFNGIFASFKAFDTQTQLPALIVAVHETDIPGTTAWAAFEKDAKALASAPASRLCSMLGYGRDAGHYWAAYEFLTGIHVGEYVRDKGLPDPLMALTWMAELSDALAFLHRRGVVHRAISPASLFVNEMGQLKLLHCGWGNLLLAAKGGGIKHPSLTCILPFVPPETATGKRGDEGADVYAVGSNMYFLLTGEPPFWSDDPEDLASQIAQYDAPIDRLNGVVSPLISEAVAELLPRDPDDRPVNLPALGDRFQRIAQQLISEADALREQAAAEEAARLAVEQAEREDAAARAKEYAAGAAQPAMHSKAEPPKQKPPAKAPPPKKAAPTGGAAKAPPKAVIFAAGGVVGLLLLVVVGMLLFGGKTPQTPSAGGPGAVDRKNLKPDPALQKKKYRETTARVRVLGQYAKGFNSQNGRWPEKLEELIVMGAKKTDLTDSWDQEFELRGAFVISAGADGKFDSDDDMWWDAEVGKPDGYRP